MDKITISNDTLALIMFGMVVILCIGSFKFGVLVNKVGELEQAVFVNNQDVKIQTISKEEISNGMQRASKAIFKGED